VRAKTANRKKLKRNDEDYVYYESHHIIPRCMGGDDSKDNLILLTAREHFLCHWLLVEMYPNNSKLHYAFWGMCNQKNKHQNREYYISSRVYESAKIQAAIAHSELHSGKTPWNKGIPRSQEVKDAISRANLGKVHTIETRQLWSNQRKGRVAWNKGIPHTEETKLKMRGRIVSEETKLKIKKSKELNPYTHSDETLEKMRLSHLNRPEFTETHKTNLSNAWAKREIIKCPYCDIESKNKGNMTRYHFNNCKYGRVDEE